MNGLPSYSERMSAARDANGGWARLEAVRGKWRAKKRAKKLETQGKLSYDHRRGGVRVGVDFLSNERGRGGVSAHLFRGKAEMSGVGEIELDGVGAGASATWLVGDLYVDAQAGATWYEVGVDSAAGRELVKEADGLGYAMGVEAGQRMAVGEGLMVTPRAALVWSKVGVDDFTVRLIDEERVSVEDASSTKGRLGVLVETEMGLGRDLGAPVRLVGRGAGVLGRDAGAGRGDAVVGEPPEDGGTPDGGALGGWRDVQPG